MIGFNGGLIGRLNKYRTSGASSGVWTFNEVAIAKGAIAVGGDEETINVDGVNYRVHTFNAGGTFLVLANVNIEYLIVGGGGGGGGAGSTWATAGGGGAGGYREDITALTESSYSIIVGAGG